MSLTKKDLNFLFRSLPVPSEKTKQEFIDFLFTSSPGGSPGVFVDGTFFATLTAAKSAMTAGKTAYVNPGIYNENDLLTGIDPTASWYFQPGAIVDYDGTGGDPTKALFDSSSLVSYQGQILGYGIFKKATDASFKGIFYANNAADNFYFEAISLNSQGNTTVWVDDGSLLARVTQTVESVGGGALFTSPGGSIILYADKITDTKIAVQATGGTMRIFARNINTSDNVQSTIEILNAAADIKIIGAEIENTHPTDGRVVQNNGILTLKNCEIEGTNINELILHAISGKLRSNNTNVKNKGVTAFSHVIKVSVSGLILNQVKLITAGTGDSVNASTPQNIEVDQGVANKDVDANITQEGNNLTINPNAQ